MPVVLKIFFVQGSRDYRINPSSVAGCGALHDVARGGFTACPGADPRLHFSGGNIDDAAVRRIAFREGMDRYFFKFEREPQIRGPRPQEDPVPEEHKAAHPGE